MRVAAVVVTHRRPALLAQALAALGMQTRPLDAILLVDNGGDAGADRSCWPAGVSVIRPHANLGGAGGFALGMRRAYTAGYDWIWLLDDDAIARPDALARLLDAALGPAAGAGALCGAVREFGDLALRHRRRYHAPTGIERPLARAAYAGPPCHTDTGSFVGFLVSASAVARAGLPDPAFFLAYDDTEYSLRLSRAGLPVWLVPGSVVEHLRERRARLRAGPFGPRHYFTIRNRIAVARRYGALPVIPGGLALLSGLGLWLASGGRLRRGALRILLRALRDGWHGRLGPFPAELARHQSQPPLHSPPGPPGTIP